MKLVEKWNWKTVWSSIYEISYIPPIFFNNLVANSAITVDLCWKDTKAELDWRIFPLFHLDNSFDQNFTFLSLIDAIFVRWRQTKFKLGFHCDLENLPKKLFFKIFSLRLPQKLTCQVLHVPLNAQIMWFSNCRH